MKIKFKKAKWLLDNEGAWLILNADRKQAIQFCENMKEGKTYQAELKEYKEKRSLDSNAYLWLLCNEIANVLRTDKDSVYKEMLKRYGQSEIVSVLSHVDVSGYFKYYDEFGITEFNGMEYAQYIVYKGSSEYDTKEMAVLIDGVVEEAKALDIETLTERELALMKEN